jgi:putative nucleotidyltransferase with HDIG domain
MLNWQRYFKWFSTTISSRIAQLSDQAQSVRLWGYIASVTLGSASLTLFGITTNQPIHLVLLLLLVVVTVLAEVFNVNLYGEGSISVAAGMIIAAGLTNGIAGAALVSLASAVGARIALYRNERRPFEIQKVLFNWAVHTLAVGIPLLLLSGLNPTLSLQNLASLTLTVLMLAIAYFAIETGLIALVIAIASGQSFHSIWRNQYRWLFGHYVVLLFMGAFLAIAYTEFGYAGLSLFILPMVMLRYAMHQYSRHTDESINELKRMNRDLSKANQQITALNSDLFNTLARFFDARDPQVGSHTYTVAEYATMIARELALPEERVQLIRQAAVLHDVGKIAIPEYILNKPGRLTEDEFAQMRLHADIGAELLERSPGLQHLASFVRHHHERWDGKGYPDRLAGEEITLESRILNLCDSVEAMASDRPYKAGMPPEEVVAEVVRCAGTQFDPELVRVFLALVERHGPAFIVNSARNIDGSLLDIYQSRRQIHVLPKARPVGTVCEQIPA